MAKKKANKTKSNPDEAKLTAKQEAFCYNYLANGYNGTQAAIKAGYSEKTAKEIAAQNLTKLNIKARIDEMKNNLAETAGITALMIANEHKKIAFSSHSQLRDGWMTLKEFEDLDKDIKDCIQEIATRTITKKIPGEKESETEVQVRIKTYDKQKSLDALSNLFGLNAATKIDLNNNVKQVIIELPPEDEE